LVGSLLFGPDLLGETPRFASQPRAPEIKLIAGIVLGKENRALKLSLINNTSLPLTVVTGAIAGSRSYPTARFVFFIDFPQHSFKVECADCGPALIGGAIGLYRLVLRPRGSFDLPYIKLSSLSYVEGVDRHPVCGAHSQQSRLRITLEESGVSVNAPSANAIDWGGSVSTSIT
jgi:hypothetical protein